MYKLISLLIEGLVWARGRFEEPQQQSGEAAAPRDEGYYSLADGTLVPLGDLGIGPSEYEIKA